MIVLRAATLADQPLLAYWDTQPHVQAASGDDDPSDWFEELECDATWQENLIAELDGRPIGVIQMIDPAREETHYWGDVRPTCAPSTSGSESSTISTAGTGRR